ncbi:hypothetical protein GW17_00019797 [Ensete ventricosum]|nr:hypothetical protein GW17_00019797 [Ensete ventricosum]
MANPARHSSTCVASSAPSRAPMTSFFSSPATSQPSFASSSDYIRVGSSIPRSSEATGGVAAIPWGPANGPKPARLGEVTTGH